MIAKVIRDAVRKRAYEQYPEAVKVVEDGLDQLDEDEKLVALLWAFYAARDGGLLDKARHLALQIAEIDPKVPSIQSFL